MIPDSRSKQLDVVKAVPAVGGPGVTNRAIQRILNGPLGSFETSPGARASPPFTPGQ
jgi:hypothetical protein